MEQAVGMELVKMVVKELVKVGTEKVEMGLEELSLLEGL